MKLMVRKYILAVCAMTVVAGVSAQGLRSAYFLDGYTYGHEMNPAFMGERNYVAMPVLGQLNVGMQGNVGLSNFLYKYNDPMSKYGLTTFLHPSVSSTEFLNGLHDRNTMNVNVSTPILSFGFHKWGGFNTFSVNARVSGNVNLPYAFFDFVKTGQLGGQKTEYDFKDLTVRANAYAEVALGHSRAVNDKLTVGGKFKLLVGVGNLNAYIEEAHLTMSEDVWSVNLKGEGDLALAGTEFETKATRPSVDNTQIRDRRVVDGIDADDFSPIGGMGVGIDLGATYKMDDFVEGLTLSAAVLDLGFISWKHSLNAYNDGLISFDFQGFDNIQVKDDGLGTSKDLDDQLDDFGDDFMDMAQFYDGGTGRRVTALNATLNVGAQYVFPFYKRLTFGFLSSTHFNKPFTWTEGRFYANVSPLRWFEASVNYGISTYGSSFGWVLNFHPRGCNVFVGSDHMLTKVTPQFVPVNNLNANVVFGLNFTFGKAHR